MNNQHAWYRKFACSIAYICGIVFINKAFYFAPCITINDWTVSSVEVLVGVIYILRDFAQQEIQHYVIVAMLVGCVLSYLLVEKEIAIASVSAFFIGELLEWIIFSLSKQPLSQRLLWSSCLTVPIDSGIFLHLINMLTLPSFIALNIGKILGILSIWYLWRQKNKVHLTQQHA